MCGGANGQTDVGAGEFALGAVLSATGYGASVGVPLMLSGAGSAASGVATADQLRKQDQITAAGILKQGQMQKEGSNDVSNLVSNNIAKSAATTQAKTAQQLQAYRDALQQSNGISQSASPNVPGASKAYKAEQGVAGSTANNYIDALAKSAATTQGTQLERIGENQGIASTAGQLGLLNQQSAEQNYVTQLQVRATQANPWLQSLGMLLKGAGAAYGAAGGLASAGGAADVGAEAGGTVGTAADTAGTIQLANPLSGVGSMAQGIASSTAADAGLGSVTPSVFGTIGNNVSSYLGALKGTH